MNYELCSPYYVIRMKMKKIIILCQSLLLLSVAVFGQHNDQDTIVNNNLKDAFLNGHIHGHIRDFFLATVNEQPLQNYWANATGGALGYETGVFHQFSVGIKGSFIFNTFSSDLTEVDPITGKSSKWEKELYDVMRPGEYSDLDRLEELFVNYHFNRSFLRVGRMDINRGPLLLRRDGRMIPFVYQGLWGEVHELKNHTFYAGWINGVAPRGFTEWYNLNEAIGINNNGFEPDGTKGHYKGTANTKGIAVLGLKSSSLENLKIMAWNYWFHNMMNITWLQLDGQYDQFYAGVQYVHERPTYHQDELEYNDRYMQPNERANILSSQIGYKLRQLDISGAYLHGFSTGRFLFPRELGREDFYVSQPRAFIDGLGDVDVYMLRFKYSPRAVKDLKIDLRISRTITQGSGEVEFNKYGQAPFDQITGLVDYNFHGKMDGTSLRIWYISRFDTAGEIVPIEKKASAFDFHHFGVTTDIAF